MIITIYILIMLEILSVHRILKIFIHNEYFIIVIVVVVVVVVVKNIHL
jgi:hypothetical protein